MRKFIPRVIYESDKLEARSTFKANILAQDTGVYRIEFDNSYSWFNSKFLKYSVHVLEPETDLTGFENLEHLYR